MDEALNTSEEKVNKPTFPITLMYLGLVLGILWPIGLIWGLIQRKTYGLGRILTHAGISLSIAIILGLLLLS